MNEDYYILQQWDKLTDDEERYNLLERIDQLKTEIRTTADELDEAFARGWVTVEARLKKKLELLEGELNALEG